MVQTLNDMLSDQPDRRGRLTVWLRVIVELPINVIEENISKLGGTSMNKLTKVTPKQYLYGFYGLLLIGSYIILAVAISTQYNRNKVLSDRIDSAQQQQRAMSGGDYMNVSVVPSDNAVYFPQARLKVADTRLNEQLVYTYHDSQPSPDPDGTAKPIPAQISISTHNLARNNYATAQFDCSQVVYADFTTPSYPVNPAWKSNGSVKLFDGRTMNVYYAPSIKGCDQSWSISNIDSKAIADALKQAVSY